MPQLIRYTYGPDVREHGEAPVLVEDMEATTLVDHLRRAERVDPAELTKPELLDVADQADAPVKKSAPKKQVIEVVAEAVGGAESNG